MPVSGRPRCVASFVEFMEAGGWGESERSPDDCARRCAEFGICPTRTGPEWLKESAALLDFFDLHALAPKEWADMGRSLRMRMGEILGYSEAWSSQESFLSQARMQLLYAAAMAAKSAGRSSQAFEAAIREGSTCLFPGGRAASDGRTMDGGTRVSTGDNEESDTRGTQQSDTLSRERRGISRSREREHRRSRPSKRSRRRRRSRSRERPRSRDRDRHGDGRSRSKERSSRRSRSRRRSDSAPARAQERRSPPRNPPVHNREGRGIDRGQGESQARSARGSTTEKQSLEKHQANRSRSRSTDRLLDDDHDSAGDLSDSGVDKGKGDRASGGPAGKEDWTGTVTSCRPRRWRPGLPTSSATISSLRVPSSALKAASNSPLHRLRHPPGGDVGEEAGRHSGPGRGYCRLWSSGAVNGLHRWPGFHPDTVPGLTVPENSLCKLRRQTDPVPRLQLGE